MLSRLRPTAEWYRRKIASLGESAKELIGPAPAGVSEKLSATKLARKNNTSADAIQQQLIRLGYIEVRSGFHYFTDLGRSVGGEWRQNDPKASDLDGYMVWPSDILVAVRTERK